MEDAMREALKEYGHVIKREGWQAGELLIQEEKYRFKDFEKWANALAIALRTKELLEETRSDGGCAPFNRREP